MFFKYTMSARRSAIPQNTFLTCLSNSNKSNTTSAVQALPEDETRVRNRYGITTEVENEYIEGSDEENDGEEQCHMRLGMFYKTLRLNIRNNSAGFLKNSVMHALLHL